MSTAQLRDADRVATGPDPDALAHTLDPGVAAAVWQRPRDAAFAEWIDTLAPDALPALRVKVAPAHAGDAVRAACARAGTPRGAMRERLAEDVGALALIFAGLMAAPMLGLRLDVVADDACRRFHCDRVTARLLCTLRGRGTQFVVGAPGTEPAETQELSTGSAAIFRGALWPGETTRLLHRSPPVAGRGETRLLLVLDPLAQAP